MLPMMGMHGAGHGGHGDHQEVETFACPVCKMDLKVSDSTPRATYQGKLYYFDSEDHLKEFFQDPQKYLQEGKDSSDHKNHGEH